MEAATTIRAQNSLLEAAPDALLVVEAASGTVTAANAAARRLFARPREEVEQCPLAALFAPGAVPGGAAWRSVLGPSGALPLRVRRGDGSEFDAELEVGPEWGPVLVLSVRSRGEPLPGEELLRRMLETAPDAMLVAESTGRIVVANGRAETLFGWPPDELVGQPVEMLVPAPLREVHREHRRAYEETPRARPMGAPGQSFAAVRRDGSTFPAEISLSPLRTPQGLLVVAAVRDVTERRRAEDERLALAREHEAVRAREEVLAVASHDLRAPLAALRLQVENALRLLRREPAAPDAVVGLVERMDGTSRRLAMLLDGLLELSSLRAGKLVLRRESVDAAALAREIAQEQAGRVQPGSEARVSVHADGPVPAFCDPVRLEQIISNLVSNAVKYGRGNPVDVTVRSEGGWAELVVADRGVGVAPEHLERIFESFERAGARQAGGYGLGLWIVRQLVEAHGGTIRVRSSPDEGSVFSVRLPSAGPADGSA